MPRFFVKSDAVTDNNVTISGDDSRHIARALRMAVGDLITVVTDGGEELECRLLSIRDSESACEILNRKQSECEPPIPITLYMAYPKGDKMETVVQKAVELGACRIIPFESERIVKRPPEDKMDRLTARLGRIAEEAAKQCGRGIIPEVAPLQRFDRLLELIGGHGLTLFCYEGEGAVSLKEVLSSLQSPPTDIGVIIGSEGGFSPLEAEKICNKGAKCVNLGPRILRCETAPDYCLSAISYHFELK